MKSVTVAVLVLMALTGVASAKMYQVYGPVVTSTPIPNTLTDWSGTLSFDKFDPSLGTLRGVDLWLGGSLHTTLTVANNSDESASNGHANTHVQIAVSDPYELLGMPTIDLYSPNYNYSLNTGEQTTSGTLTKTGSFSSSYWDSGTIEEFTGPGSLVLNGWTFTETALYNTGGNTAASQVTQADLTGSVTYYYDAATVPPVPEPVTMTLVGLGLAGLGGYIRRRTAA